MVDNLNTPILPRVILTSDYNELGNRTSLAANIAGADDFVNNYLYDELSRMIGVEQTSVATGSLPFQDKQVNFTYNAASQFVFIDRYANGDTNQLVASSSYNYDGAGRLTGLTLTGVVAGSGNPTTLAGFAYTVDALSRITSVTEVDWTRNGWDQVWM